MQVASEWEKAVNEFLRNPVRQASQRGYEIEPGYLGMSNIGGCPRAAYDAMLRGDDQETDSMLFYSLVGRIFEDAMLDFLQGSLSYVGQSRVRVYTPGKHDPMGDAEAHWDNRFRGHIDAWVEPGDGTKIVVDVKTVSYKKLNKIRKLGAKAMRYTPQLQMYMRHGNRANGFDHGVLFFVAREVDWLDWPENNDPANIPVYIPTGPDGHPAIELIDIVKSDVEADELDQKARMILNHYDRGTPPRCECGYCKEAEAEEVIPF